MFRRKYFGLKSEKDFEAVGICEIFEDLDFRLLQENGLVIGKFHNILKIVVREKFVKEIDIFFLLNAFLAFLFDGIDKVIKIGTIIINKSVNEGFANDGLFFILDFLLFFEGLILMNLTKIRTRF